jgi:hypothetical protein
MFGGFGAWSLYDGLIAYPRQRALYNLAYDQDDQLRDDWQQRLAEAGYPDIEDPTAELTKRVTWDIRTQYIMAAICLPIGVIFLGSWVRTGGRWIGLENDTVRTSRGQQVPLRAFNKLDKTRWRTKGIAVAHYDDAGDIGRITLDDWKYERVPTRRLIEKIESQLGPDQIIGDEPEADQQTPSTAEAPADEAPESSGGAQTQAPEASEKRES